MDKPSFEFDNACHDESIQQKISVDMEHLPSIFEGYFVTLHTYLNKRGKQQTCLKL